MLIMTPLQSWSFILLLILLVVMLTWFFTHDLPAWLAESDDESEAEDNVLHLPTAGNEPVIQPVNPRPKTRPYDWAIDGL